MRALRITPLLAALALSQTVAEATPSPRQVRGHLRAQLEGGASRVRLDVAGLPFGPVTLTGARETESGAFHGKARYGGASVEALFHFQPRVPGGKRGTWLLAYKLPAQRLSQLAPSCGATLVDQLDLSAPILVFSLGEVHASPKALGKTARAFYGRYAKRALELAKGVNLVTSAQARPGTLLHKTLRLLKLERQQVNLRGVVLRGFKLGELKEARDRGELKQALGRDTELRGSLPDFRLPGLPRAFKTSSAYLSVTGEPGVGVGFSLTIGSGAKQKVFDAHLGVRKIAVVGDEKQPKAKGKGPAKVADAADATKQATEVTIAAGCEGRWENAFGIKGFDLDEVRLLLTVDSTQRLAFGLRAAMQFGQTPVMIAGKLKLHGTSGAPIGGMFAFRVGKLSSADLITFANAVAKPVPQPRRKGRKARPLAQGRLPSFALVDVSGRFAPLGGEPSLGIESGIALKGTLVAFKRRLLSVDATLDQTTFIPTLRVWGRAARVDLGAVALDKAAVDIKLGPTLDPFFRVKGGTRLLGATKRLDVDISRKRFRIDLLDKVAGVYEARYKVSSPSRGKPSWDVKVVFTNHLHETLEQGVSRKALAWAKNTRAAFDKADADLRRALGALEVLDRKIDAKRRLVRRERAEKQANLNRAIAEVSRLDGAIHAREREVAQRQAPLRKAAARAKQHYQSADRAWKKAKREHDRAKGLKKAGLKAKVAAKWTKRANRKNTYKLLSGKLLKALSKVDAKLASLKTAKGTALVTLKTARAIHKASTKTPVDLDPRVAGVLTQRGAAVAAVQTARGVVKVTGGAVVGSLKIAAWAAKHHGAVLEIHRVSYGAKLAAHLRGSHVQLKLRVSLLGAKPRTFTLRIQPADLRARKGFLKRLWKQLKPSLKDEADRQAKREKR